MERQKGVKSEGEIGPRWWQKIGHYLLSFLGLIKDDVGKYRGNTTFHSSTVKRTTEGPASKRNPQ